MNTKITARLTVSVTFQPNIMIFPFKAPVIYHFWEGGSSQKNASHEAIKAWQAGKCLENLSVHMAVPNPISPTACVLHLL
jgi:hypothetical protein